VVQGARLLLILTLLGCRAELLGVELPRGGRDSISQEDLQRDTWLLAQIPDRGENAEQVARVLSQRFQQMHTRPGFSRSYVSPAGDARVVCAEKDGRGAGHVLILAEDLGSSVASGAAPAAALISVLKGFDTPDLPPRSVMVCVLVGPDARAHLLSQPPLPLADAELRIVGPLGSGDARTEPDTFGGHPVVRHSLGAVPSPDTMESLDYRALQQVVLGLFDAASASQE
jgi:hypothetical protein